MQEKDYLEYKNLFEKKRKRFLNAVNNFQQEQNNVLLTIIDTNKNSDFGNKYCFNKIESVNDFQNAVPISQYEDYTEYIEKIKNGEKNILTSEEVILLEPTGGSTSGSKYIPYTKSLKEAFNNGIEPWLSDIFINFPEILTNSMYWSITPTTKIKITNTKIPVGFDKDIEYLNPPFSEIISGLIITPDIENLNTEEFYNITLDELKKHTNLAFISIWNPTLLLNLLEKEKKPYNIWKNLKLISCWDDGNSNIYANKLKQIFPHTYIQGKGLLATEGIITIPMEGIGRVPAVQSHFYEFIDTISGEICLLRDLKVGKEYSVLITTQGGLYRYKIGDIVQVYGTYKSCPLLRFIRRENNTSDYFGEKLNEEFVQNILIETGITNKCEFYLFAPYKNKKEFYYTLYYENDKTDIEKYSLIIEEKLKENYHYKYARELNQLKGFKITGIKNGNKQYLKNCIRKGQKLGDIKPITFSNSTDWKFKTEEY